MRHVRHPRAWMAGSAGMLSLVTSATMLAAFSGGASAVTAGARPSTHARPVTAAVTATAAKTHRYPVKPFVQNFQANTNLFCPPGSGNPACDGTSNGFGTIDRVPSRFSNGGGGNYAPFTKALQGKWMALVTGSQTINQGPSQGCPVPGTEACTGPFALFGTGKAMGSENVFPKQGFTVTNDLYLSPSSVTTAGTMVDDDIALNKSNLSFGIDNVITACAEPTAAKTMGFVINFGNGSPGSCTGTPVITKDGWYRFVFVFSDKNGQPYITRYVRKEKSGKVVARTPREMIGGTPSSVKTWGGPLYFWLPTLQMSGMPLANFALQMGVVPTGHKA